MYKLYPERGTRLRNEGQDSGTRNETPERGTRLWDGARDPLRPCPNGVINRGNEDPPCVHMGGMSDPFLDV